jgi:hypothetical protein
MAPSKTIRVLLAVLLLPIGAVLVLLAGADRSGQLVSSLGVSLMVAGLVSVFREAFLSGSETKDTVAQIARELESRQQHSERDDVSIRLVSKVRRGYTGYYEWAIETAPQNLFFSGRSVLHRIDADFKNRGIGPASDILTRKLVEGSAIRILFLDPRSKLLPRLAREEGQTLASLKQDLSRSLEICEQAARDISSEERQLPGSATLIVRVYDEVPYFSYHKEDEQSIVGFYFASALGSSSSAFELGDSSTRALFEGHFASIFDRASSTTIIEVSGARNRVHCNDFLIGELRTALADAQPAGAE